MYTFRRDFQLPNSSNFQKTEPNRQKYAILSRRQGCRWYVLHTCTQLLILDKFKMPQLPVPAKCTTAGLQKFPSAISVTSLVQHIHFRNVIASRI